MGCLTLDDIPGVLILRTDERVLAVLVGLRDVHQLSFQPCRPSFQMYRPTFCCLSGHRVTLTATTLTLPAFTILPVLGSRLRSCLSAFLMAWVTMYLHGVGFGCGSARCVSVCTAAETGLIGVEGVGWPASAEGATVAVATAAAPASATIHVILDMFSPRSHAPRSHDGIPHLQQAHARTPANVDRSLHQPGDREVTIVVPAL